MPNRIIKESICTSDQIDKLSTFAEIFFYRLIVNADDFGRMDGRAAVLRSRLFPLKDVRNSQIEDALRELASVELVSTYVVDGKPFVRLPGWDRHQQIRAKKSKYPAPDETCNQMISGDSKCPRNPIQSESESESEPESEPARGGADVRPDFNTVEVYAANNLAALNAGNMQEFIAFKDELPEELIRHAIDEACAAGKRTWSYTRAILTRYRDSGFKTVGEAKAAKPPAKSVAASAPVKRNYQERATTDETYGKNSYSDPTKDLE
jgi:DnaD/phage-associated family protein